MGKSLGQKLDSAEKAMEESAPKGKKFKKWTNDPEKQNQETGETTAAGKAHKAKVTKKTGVDQGEDEEAPAKPKGFSKVSTGGKKPSAGKPKAEKSNEPDTRKIKVLNKECPYREDSGRAESFNIMLKSKTVQDYVDAGGKIKYIPRWEAAKIISLS